MPAVPNVQSGYGKLWFFNPPTLGVGRNAPPLWKCTDNMRLGQVLLPELALIALAVGLLVQSRALWLRTRCCSPKDPVPRP